MLSFVFSSSSEYLVSTWNLGVSLLVFCQNLLYIVYTFILFPKIIYCCADSFSFSFGLFLDGKEVG